MAFNDAPIVDNNAKASQESVIAVRSLFTEKKGFILREPHPDYGIDLDIELIIDGDKASGWEFPIQIKSAQSINKVPLRKENFISLEFPTSRLGYLCNKPPAYGLIVIYDDASKVCYYDYVEKIVERATLQRNSDSWKLQENVNINIPVKNVLSADEISGIHNKFLVRFINNRELIAQFGKSFDIPSFSVTTGEKLSNLDSPEKIIPFIEKYGIELFNRQDFLVIESLLSKLNFEQILQSPKLLFVAAITYESVGRFIDAEYFLSKSLQQKSIPKDEETLLRAAKAEVDYVFGNITVDEYYSQLEKILNQNSDLTIAICLKARLIHLRIAKSKLDEEDFEEIMKDIENLFHSVESPSLSETIKYHYKIALATDLLLILSRTVTNIMGSFSLREKIFGSIPLSERVDAAQMLLPLLKVASDIYTKALEFAVDNKDELLQAYILYAQGFSAFMFEIDLAILGKVSLDIQNCRTQYYNLLRAYNYFIKNGMIDNAYKAITTAYDINKMCQLFLQKSIEDVEEEKLEGLISKIEKDTGRHKYLSCVEEIAKEKKKIEQMDPDIEMMNMSDKEIERYATDLTKYLRIPEERKGNLINDLRFTKEANKEIKGTHFQLLQNLEHTKSIKTFYAVPLSYILKCEVCGFETKPSDNLQSLLLDKKIHHPHVCL